MKTQNELTGGTLNTRQKTVQLAKMGLLAAISILLMALVHFPIFPPAPFLKYDPADIPILIASFSFGPLAGLLLTVIVAVIHGISFSASGPYGVLMNIIATGALVLVAGFIYRFSPSFQRGKRLPEELGGSRHIVFFFQIYGGKTRKMAAVALICGTLAMVLIMIPANLIVTPLFMGAPVEAVKALLLPAILPFNLIKAGLNSLITFLLYKRISKYLHANR
ncbi:MAG: ECF transporter S component [Clostridiales Family XIII bacterium]|jgi:riboflavin transporter FmnP|nr:ECF transporter S component [Clostridiales Family XIII bacterium]